MSRSLGFIIPIIGILSLLTLICCFVYLIIKGFKKESDSIAKKSSGVNRIVPDSTVSIVLGAMLFGIPLGFYAYSGPFKNNETFIRLCNLVSFATTPSRQSDTMFGAVMLFSLLSGLIVFMLQNIYKKFRK